MVDIEDGQVPMAYYDETSNSRFGFHTPEVGYEGTEEGTEEGTGEGTEGLGSGEGTEGGELIDIEEGVVPLEMGVTSSGTDLVIRNDHVSFEHHYDLVDSYERITAFPGNLLEQN